MEFLVQYHIWKLQFQTWGQIPNMVFLVYFQIWSFSSKDRIAAFNMEFLDPYREFTKPKSLYGIIESVTLRFLSSPSSNYSFSPLFGISSSVYSSHLAIWSPYFAYLPVIHPGLCSCYYRPKWDTVFRVLFWDTCTLDQLWVHTWIGLRGESSVCLSWIRCWRWRWISPSRQFFLCLVHAPGQLLERKRKGGKSPIGILNKVGPFQEILKIVTNLFIFDRSCQKTITLLVSYKR